VWVGLYFSETVNGPALKEKIKVIITAKSKIWMVPLTSNAIIYSALFHLYNQKNTYSCLLVIL